MIVVLVASLWVVDLDERWRPRSHRAAGGWVRSPTKALDPAM
ncbi:hypothetical protein [Rhodococcus sp. ACS1]|nr:hypothetical protein [Rhodococcus sp. ACS1]